MISLIKEQLKNKTRQRRFKHVGVLMGGWSREREVSLNTGKMVVEALKERGYCVTPIIVERDLKKLLQDIETAQTIDVLFLALHGKGVEDGCIQGALEIMGIPYTFSGVLSSALGMNKAFTKQFLSDEGILCPKSVIAKADEIKLNHLLPPPYVVKPIDEGSSVGVHLVFPGEMPPDLTSEEWPESKQFLVEQYIPGREINVAVMAGRALGTIEIVPKVKFFDYQAKYIQGYAEHFTPPRIPQAAIEEAKEIALKAFQALGCEGCARIDLRYDDVTNPHKGTFYFLEINTQPGMTGTSLVPEIAEAQGLSYGELMEWIVEEARCDEYAKIQGQSAPQEERTSNISPSSSKHASL